jgi:uncharacterized protein DUF3471
MLPRFVVALLLAGSCLAQRKEVTVPASVLSKYVGTYEMAPGVDMMIRLPGDQLTVQLSGQQQIPLFPESETMFFTKVVDAEVEFGTDDKGPFLILHQGGRDQKAPRTSATVAEKKEIQVSPAILSKYVGTYELQPGFDLVVTLEGEQLMTQATGQGKLPIFAESETKFFPKAIDAEIDFFKDDKGAVTYLVLHQGPNEIKAMRK